MASNQEPHFTFTVSGMARDTFHVVRFSGVEGLSRLYQFDIALVSEKQDLDFSKVLSGTAELTVKRDTGGDISWHGAVRSFQQHQMVDRFVFYRAVLVPKAWQASIAPHNQIFLNKDMPQFLKDCLADAGLSQGLDFEVRASRSFPKREYVCQFNETHYAFASRWMERTGFTFFFDQSGAQEKMVVVDSLNEHAAHPGGDTLYYAQPSGLDAEVAGQVARNFHAEERRLPAQVLAKDYNYRTPGLSIEATEQVSPRGTGQAYLHGRHLRSAKDAQSVALVHAQSLACREKLFYGESNAPFVQAGYVFSLERHYRDEFNQKYLAIEVKHEGAQESAIASGLGLGEMGDKLFYRNAFAAIPAQVQFRAEAKTPWPRIEGVYKAVIDAEGSGQYAELDEHGRYKVVMPFDLSGRKDGQASTWLRMIQPYAGSGHGMHFPLHKGTEVAVAFYEGDPDQPVIVGAVPNPETQSVVTGSNQTMANITSSGGNKIHMEDQKGSERILLYSPQQGSYVRIGAPNDPPPPASAVDHTAPTQQPWVYTIPTDSSAADNFSNAESPSGLKLFTAGPLYVEAQLCFQFILGANTQTTVGFYSCNWLGGSANLNLGLAANINVAGVTQFSAWSSELNPSVSRASAHDQKMIGEVEKLLGQKSTLAESVNNMIAEKTNLLATKNELAQSKAAIADSCINTFATKQSLTAAKQELSTSQERLAATVNETYATKEQLTATKTEVSEEINKTAMAVMDIMEEQTKMVVNITQINETHVNMSATVIML